ncbi:MAG: 16S rRNA (guanine(527)-N(7))-methyltransferase RsmG [Sphingobacteriia bacterium]|jgi:16S rRNA (guanine527-N7)-methyltransferase|nr:16S rRNA (guanine(527)-N(7))-methyltransferase RsmG [Sphingobacteriia bacterium]
MTEPILKYFPNLSIKQIDQFAQLGNLYEEWNAKINVISRKDIGNLYEHHILHSLAIAKILHFKKDTSIVDVGTGGGFPGIPLAIMFPEVHFLLIDSIGKKVRVAEAVATSAHIENCTFAHARMEEVKEKFDFAVSRAVMPLPDLAKIVQKNIGKTNSNALPNGLICLKGGDLQNEINSYRKQAVIYNISDFFEEDYFKTKQGIYLPL